MAGQKLSNIKREFLIRKLSQHPEIRNLFDDPSKLRKVSRDVLLDLARQCKIELSTLLDEDRPLGVDEPQPLSKTRQKPRLREGSTKQVAIEGHIPLTIMISASGVEKTYESWFAYRWRQAFSQDLNGSWEPSSGEGESTLKVLTTSTDEDQGALARGPTQVQDEHGVYLTGAPFPVILSDPSLSRLLPPEALSSLWDTIQARAEAALREDDQSDRSD